MYTAGVSHFSSLPHQTRTFCRYSGGQGTLCIAITDDLMYGSMREMTTGYQNAREEGEKVTFISRVACNGTGSFQFPRNGIRAAKGGGARRTKRLDLIMGISFIFIFPLDLNAFLSFFFQLLSCLSNTSHLVYPSPISAERENNPKIETSV